MIFLQLLENEKIELINQMSEETKLAQVIIEKDLWVTVVLRALFALPYAENLSFKKAETTISAGAGTRS